VVSSRVLEHLGGGVDVGTQSSLGTGGAPVDSPGDVLETRLRVSPQRRLTRTGCYGIPPHVRRATPDTAVVQPMNSYPTTLRCLRTARGRAARTRGRVSSSPERAKRPLRTTNSSHW